MGFETPRLPTQPREGSKYLGEHHHEGKKGDLTRKTKRRSREHANDKSGIVAWASK